MNAKHYSGAVGEYHAALEHAANRDVYLTSGAVEVLSDAALAELFAALAERDRKLSAALGALDFWQTAEEEAQIKLAERDRMLARIDEIVGNVPKTGDPDSAVMDVMRVFSDADLRAGADGGK